MNPFRCSNCDKLLGMIEGKAEIKCSKCKTMNKMGMFNKEEATEQILSASKGLLTPDNFETVKNEGVWQIDADTWKDKFKVVYSTDIDKQIEFVEPITIKKSYGHEPVAWMTRKEIEEKYGK